MNIAMGAMNTLLPKLAELVVGEYKLQKGVKGEINELEKELTSMTAALKKVAEVPPDQLDEQVKIWASDVKELSYDIEDEVDTFMLRGKKEHEHTKPFSLRGLMCKASDLYKKAKTNHEIHKVIKDIMDQVKKVAERRDRYKIDKIAARPAIVTVDPRLEGMYRKATELVGIGQPKEELAKRLLDQVCSSSSMQRPNIISIVGFGGLGKTTLANSLLQDLKSKFNCHIFVSVSLNPDIKRIFKNILLQLDEKKYSHLDEAWEENQLIDKIREFLNNRRCLCVIDDLWKVLAWDDAIKLAFQDGHPESKIIITTRNRSVAEKVGGGVYELKPLSSDDSRKLLNKRIFGNEDGCPPNLAGVAGEIIKKCGGVPLAIITTASLLASKPMVLGEWKEVNKSIGSGLGNSLEVDKMRKILCLSYNDLPFHLKTCLLFLSKYPEDQVIRKDVLIWSWIAEGSIKQEETHQEHAGTNLQEIGESYFNDLINRSLIQPHVRRERDGQVHDMVLDLINRERDGNVQCCQVHDMVLDLINQLSSEEGFVTRSSSDGKQATACASVVQKRKIRRLSLHNTNSNSSIESYASPEASREQLSKVRSLDIFGAAPTLPPLLSFHVLRVLQVHDCTLLDDNHLSNLGKLRLLRFLLLHRLRVKKLPYSIGELESLETLDIRRPYSRLVLPVSLGKLGRLVRLHADRVELPDGLTLENMRSLRELVSVLVTLHAVTEIGKLRELKVLELHTTSEPNNSFGKLKELIPIWPPSLQVLTIRTPCLLHYPVDLMAGFPSSLRMFTNTGGYFWKAFPKWTKPQLSYLTVLELRLNGVHVLPNHLEQLAELPCLRLLKIQALQLSDKQRKVSCASGFPCLTYLELWSPLLFLKFQHGAMPKLQELHLFFSPIATNEHFRTNDFDYGFENLASVRHFVIEFCGKRPGPEAEDAIRKTVNNTHGNHPSIDFAYI